MSDANITVDVLSLEEFGKTLAGRLSEVESMSRTLRTELGSRRPALGRFHDAEETGDWYQRLHQQYVDRIERLRTAVLAAQQATATIIANYRTTEERNRANAADIAAKLDPIRVALGPVTALDEGYPDV